MTAKTDFANSHPPGVPAASRQSPLHIQVRDLSNEISLILNHLCALIYFAKVMCVSRQKPVVFLRRLNRVAGLRPEDPPNTKP